MAEAKAQITSFAKFFKAYGIGLSLVTAAVPLAVGQWDLLPSFEGIKGPITFITSVTCYLVVGFIFAHRHDLGRLFFPGRLVGTMRVASARQLKMSKFVRLLPGVLALLCIFLFFIYLLTVHDAEQEIALKYMRPLDPDNNAKLESWPIGAKGQLPYELPIFALRWLDENRVAAEKTIRVLVRKVPAPNDKLHEYKYEYEVLFDDEQSVTALRKSAPSTAVPHWLMGILFLGTFLSAVSAFVMMGLQDYIQEQMGISDVTLLTEERIGTREEKFFVEEVPDLYGFVEFNPHDSQFDPVYRGPFCIWHDKEPTPRKFESGIVTGWQHVSEQNGKKVVSECSLQAMMSPSQLDAVFRQSGRNQAQARMNGTIELRPYSLANQRPALTTAVNLPRGQSDFQGAVLRVAGTTVVLFRKKRRICLRALFLTPKAAFIIGLLFSLGLRQRF
jgi:hypothetical protein